MTIFAPSTIWGAYGCTKLALSEKTSRDKWKPKLQLSAQQAAEKAVKAVMSLKKMAASSRVTARSDGYIESRFPNTALGGVKIVAMEASTC